MPHEEGLRTCPATGRAIVRAPAPPAPRVAPSIRPPPAPPPPVAAYAPPAASPRAARESVDFDLVGTLIGGKYRVRDILGQGGMGTVFEALREGLGNMVAIKVLHPNQLQKKDAVQRFHHEARAAARIGHPNICEVYDVGTLDDGRPYLVMDRLTGVTLADRIQSLGGLPFQEVIDTLTQVLSGLHAAHEKGIIHRDIKPENVFLSQRVGCPPLAKILDFGVSKVMTHHAGAAGFSDVEVTRTGIVLGTPYYLAPEQARGERNLDARVDLYACGILLYEALTGRRPFRAPNYNALLIAILTSTPRPAREIRPDIPGGFTRILEKSIERDSKDRYQTALDFQAALQPYSHTPLPTRTTPPSRPPPRRATSVAPAAIAPRPEPISSVEDLQSLLESASSDALVPPPPAPPPPPRSPSFVPPPFRPAGNAPNVSKVPSRVPPRPTPAPPAGPAPRPASMRPPTTAVAPVVAIPKAPYAAPAPVAEKPPAQKPVPEKPVPEKRPHLAPRKASQNFDEQATEVDLPRSFHTDAAPAHRSSSTAPRTAAIDAFAPRRAAPVLGPPLQPPAKLLDEDESATEIMSAAVRGSLPEPEGPRKPADAARPHPGTPRPPRR